LIPRNKEKRILNKLALIAYKGDRCLDCGNTYRHVCYDFDHRDPFQKAFQIATNYSKPLGELKLEADKCDLVCSNCHRIRTAGSLVIAKKLAEGQRGRKHSPESIEKRVAKIRGRHYDPEHRRAISEGKKKFHHNRGRIPWNKGKTGLQTAWNKGLPSSNKGKRLLELLKN
jgi:hypothetical protein